MEANMVLYVKTGPMPFITASSGAAGGSPVLPNFGVSVIAATSSDIYTLKPPEAGVEKVILFDVSSSTGLTHTIRGSSAQTVTFSGGTLGGNTALPTMFKLAATRSTNMNVCVSLVGKSSVEWIVKSVYPVMTTGNGGGSVTFSTT
jgi:hypothetical protein